MAYEKVYSRINWENEPSTKSPINEDNLNKMDFALNEIDNRTVELSGYESIVIDYSNQAKTSATNALSSETKAKTSEQNAYSYEQSALTSKNQAEVFKNEAETHANNASASERNAKLSEDNASASELLAKNSEENASDFATSASRSSENASGFAEYAETSAQKAKASEDIAVASASSAKTDSVLAKSYTVGTHGEVRENDDTDNAKYYYEQTKGISQSLSGVLKPIGTIVFDNLPSSPNSGDMYNISNEFITDDRFKEGTGKTMPIGTNVYFTADGYWDCLAGSPVTGIKGSNETSYRQGNVEITKENLGLGNVPNVSTNDQQPTYSEATTLETLKSGEKLSVSFGKIMKAISDLKSHIGNNRNPHSVTKAQVGLGNCDNTSDANKPVSTATQNALNLKANKNDLSSHTGNKSNPHGVTKAQVGLGNVPNVATNDQTPTYNIPSEIAELESGEKLSAAFGKIAKAIKEFIGYKSHVGMIIHSTTLDTMAKVIAIYGGTKWVKIEGRFLLGQSSSYAINSTGGEAAHTLTINEMPSHNHTIDVSESTGNYGNMPLGGAMKGIVNDSISSVGGGKAHNNMPPYKTVYIWERTA